MEEKLKQIKRTVHFYELHAITQDDYVLSKKYDTMFRHLLGEIVVLAQAKDPARYQPFGERSFFINEIIFEPTPKKSILKGKLLSVRKDFFPELMDTESDALRDIDALEAEGIVETTHFMIQENNDGTGKVKIAIEYNLYGAKINDLIYYLMALGTKLKILKRLQPVPIQRNVLKKLKERMGAVAKILIRVQSDHIEALKKVDTGMASLFKKAKEEFKQDYVTMEFKYDYQAAKGNPQLVQAKQSKAIVNNFVDHLIEDKNNAEGFDALQVEAEDEEKNNRLAAFDLLVDKVKDELKVNRKPKSRTLLSEDMFEKMKHSFTLNRL